MPSAQVTTEKRKVKTHSALNVGSGDWPFQGCTRECPEGAGASGQAVRAGSLHASGIEQVS